MNYVTAAQIDDPDGQVCGYCGKQNDNADDIGWWYYVDYPEEFIREVTALVEGVTIPWPDKVRIGYRALKDKYNVSSLLAKPACLECEKLVRPKHTTIHGVGDR